ncbi:transposase [Cohnella suwonensis]|uniref:Transposase n=1 Tax=Cohnella suwonensis TaxID=696072 RepID=A0ABW0LTF0_9BACL
MSIREAQASFEEFCNRYSTEDSCIESLFRSKWPNGFLCPRCGFTECYLISTRRLPLYECRSCRAQTSLIAGTIMEGSRTPLRLWFQAIYLHTRPQCVNALQLSNSIGVTYKTAWLMCHKIRHAMSRAESGNLLSGIVRVSDSVYCKRLTPYFDWHPQEQALLIGSSVTKKGNIDQLKIKVQSKSLLKDKYDCPDPKPFIHQNVEPSSKKSVVFARKIHKNKFKELIWMGYHVTWWIAGLFRGIGPKHLQSYLDQYCYFYNRPQRSMFDLLLTDCANASSLTYPVLTRSERSYRTARQPRTASLEPASIG